MKKKEFEKTIKKLGLEKVYKDGILQTYLTATKEYYVDVQKFNAYGCYRNEENKYVIFFSDSERGILVELGKFETEDEAYDNLLETVKGWGKNKKKAKG